MRQRGMVALAAIVTQKSVRFVLGTIASILLLGLIVHDAIQPGYTLEPATIYLLTAFIWAFLGVDVLAQVHKPGDSPDGDDDSRGDSRDDEN